MILSAMLSLTGGLAFFLYGLSVLSGELRRLAGGRLERLAASAAATPLRGFAAGILAAAALQSSSAFTAMLVGFAEGGLICPGQLPGLLLGADVGSTVTPWLLLWNGGASVRPSPLCALAGILLLLGGRKRRYRDLGRVLLGFAVLLCGMEQMSDALRPLAGQPAFLRLLSAFSHPAAGFLGGAVFTAVIQSSAASIGILQALSLGSIIPYGAAIPLILGQNAGTCSTALLAALTAGREGRTVAWLHIALKVSGTAVCLLLLILGCFPRSFLDAPATPVGIALFHTAFNLCFAGTFLPLSPWIGAAAEGRAGERLPV